MRALLKSALPLVLAISTSCGDDAGSPARPSAPLPPTPSRASISVSVAPNPVIAQPSPDPRFDWTASWTVVFQESAGVGFNVDFMNLDGTSVAAGVALGTLNFGAAEIIQSSGTNHVSGRSAHSIPVTVGYRLPQGSRQIAVSVSAQCTDDLGNVINVGTNFPIALKEQ